MPRRGTLLRRRAAAAAPPLPPPPDRPGDFWESFVSWFTSDLELTAAFPGGLVHARAAPRQAYPYARMSQVDPQDPLSADDWPMETHLSAYAASDVRARELALLMLRKLDDTAARAPLQAGGWVEASHQSTGRVELTPLGRASDGDPVWRADVDYRFHVRAPAPDLAEDF